MRHFSEGNQEEVPYDYNILSSKHREDYSEYDKSMTSHSFDAVHCDGTTVDIETMISVLVKKNLMSINSVLIAIIVNPSNDRVCQLDRDICRIFNIYYIIVHFISSLS